MSRRESKYWAQCGRVRPSDLVDGLIYLHAHDGELLNFLELIPDDMKPAMLLARPSPAAGLRLAADGRVIYGLRRHWRDGTSAVSFDPLTFIERLAAPVPRPQLPIANCSCRGQWIDWLRATWAELLKRVFAVRLLECPHCGGRRMLIAFISDGVVVRKILDHRGLPSEPPRFTTLHGDQAAVTMRLEFLSSEM